MINISLISLVGDKAYLRCYGFDCDVVKINW